MSLESGVAYGQILVGTEREKRDGLWAYEVCNLSRELREDVVECYPPAEYVQGTIVPLLQLLPGLIAEVLRDGRVEPFSPDDLRAFSKNIEDRVAVLLEYADGVPIVPAKQLCPD